MSLRRCGRGHVCQLPAAGKKNHRNGNLTGAAGVLDYDERSKEHLDDIPCHMAGRRNSVGMQTEIV